MKTNRILFIVIFCIILTCSALHTEDFIKRSVLPDNITYLFDRNSIKDFKIIDKYIIALTSSGNILRFGLNPLKQSGELIDSLPYSCIGDVIDGNILIGREDGAIFSLSSKDLSEKLLYKINSKLYFIVTIMNSSDISSQLICVSYDPVVNHYDKITKEKTQTGGFTYIQNLTKDKIDSIVTKFGGAPDNLFKSYDNLIYFGVNCGEFGDYYSIYYPTSGRAFNYEGSSSQMNGFINSSDSSMIAYGGLSHLGGTEVRISEIKNACTTTKYFYSNFDEKTFQWKKNDTLEKGPKESIDFILENKKKNCFYVISDNSLFEAGSNFSTWKKLCELKIPIKITKAEILNSDIILCSSTSDGFFTYSNNTQSYISVENQFSDEYQIYKFFPFSRFNDSLYNTTKSFDIQTEYVFQTPDDNIWILKDSYLKQFNGIKWEKKCSIEGWDESTCCRNGFYFNTITNSKPWIIIDNYNNLFKLDYDKDLSDMSCKVQYPVDKDTFKVFDGCTYNNSTVILTNKGLYNYNNANGIAIKLNFELPDTNIKHICTDSKGRLWLAGKGLFVVNSVKDFENNKFSRINSLGNQKIGVLLEDKNSTGVLVSIYNRGIYIIK